MMARVTLPDGRRLEVEDRNTPVLDYYRGLGAAVTSDSEEWPEVDDTPAVVEFQAWVASSTVAELSAAVEARPEIAGAVLDAEQQRDGGPRKTLLEALDGLRAAADEAASGNAELGAQTNALPRDAVAGLVVDGNRVGDDPA